MGEIVNLRRARKHKARAEAGAKAAANRAVHGAPKHARNATRAETERESRNLDQHRLKDE